MNRTFLLIPASILIVAGVVAGLWALGSASGERAKFSSLEVAPAQADVFFAVNTDPTSPQWLAVNDSLDDIKAKDPIRGAIDDALAEVNLEWDRDIAPVAGDEAFFSIPDIKKVGNEGGWTAGVLLNDPDHASEVFDQLRERDDSPPLLEEEYEGVTIWVTDADSGASAPGGRSPVFQLATPTPSPDESTPTPVPSYFNFMTECPPVSFGEDTPAPTPQECADEPFDGFFEPFFDCGGFGYNVDGSPNEDVFGGEPCEGDADYCLWWGFVPTGDELNPYTTEPCVGSSSFCGNYGFEPAATPAPDGLPCGSDFDFWFEEIPYNPEDLPEDDPIFEYNDENFPEGEDIFDVNPTPDLTAIAFVDNVMVLGGSVDDVKAVIDVVQGRADNALSNERLQEFREGQKEDFLVWGYMDLVDVWAEAEDEAPPGISTDFDTNQAFEQLRSTYDRVGFSISSFTEGFAFDLTVVHSPDFDESKAFEPTTPFDPAIAEILPDDTMFYISMFDFYNQTWLPAREQWEDYDLGEDGSLQDIIDRIRRESAIDLERDVFELLTGEIAIAGNVKDFDDPDVSVFGIADVNDPIAAHRTMSLVGKYLTEEHVLKLRPDEADDVERWDLLDDGEGLTEFIGWQVKDDRVIVGYPDSTVDELGEGAVSLAETDDWQRTIDLLPEDKTFFGYLSIARILEEVRTTDGAEDEFEELTQGDVTLADLEPIRTLAMAGTSSEKGFGVHFVLFMKDS